MQIDFKAAVILLVTLILGIALGGVGAGALAQHRTAEVQELRRPPGFIAHMEDVIRPRDDSQRLAIAPAIEATAGRNDSIIRSANDQLRSALDSMRARLAPLLDKDQRARLDEMSRLPEPFRPPGDDGRRGAPPPDAGQRRGGPPPREGAPPRRGPPPGDAPEGPPRKGPPPRGGPPPGGGPPGGVEPLG